MWWKNSTWVKNSRVLDKKLPVTAAWLKQVPNLFGSQFLLCKMRSFNYVFWIAFHPLRWVTMFLTNNNICKQLGFLQWVSPVHSPIFQDSFPRVIKCVKDKLVRGPSTVFKPAQCSSPTTVQRWQTPILSEADSDGHCVSKYKSGLPTEMSLLTNMRHEKTGRKKTRGKKRQEIRNKEMEGHIQYILYLTYSCFCELYQWLRREPV